MGRRLRMGADCPTSSPWCAPGDPLFTATTNNHLPVSLAQAFDQTDVDSFGTQPTGLFV